MDTQKMITKLFILLCLGLTAAVLIYPLMHELSHALSAVAFGGHISEIVISPIPSVLCDLSSLSTWQKSAVGMAGVFCPALITLLLRPRKFALWYMNFYLQLTCLYSLILHLFFALCFIAGHPIQNNDLTTVLSFMPNSLPVLILLHTVCTIALCMEIKRTKPIQKLVSFFLSESDYVGSTS